MDGFIERWKTDSKFKATVQLIAYGGFALFALLFGSISIWMADSTDNNTNSINNTINDNKFYFDDKKTTIDLPNNYQYIININLNDINYTYEGVKKDDEETIVKTINQEKHNYIKKGNTFYKNTY